MRAEGTICPVRWQRPLYRLPVSADVEQPSGPLLVGDVGGTRTLLQISELRPRGYEVWFEASYVTASHPGLAAVIRTFIDRCGIGAGTLRGAGIAVTGVVKGNSIASSRLLDWIGNAKSLTELLGLREVHLTNDLLALSYGLLALGPEDRIQIQEGTPHSDDPVLVISVGSGLGQSVFVGTGNRRMVVPLEAGQAAFAPRSEKEVALWRYLRGHRTVTWEQVLSEAGLTAVARFVADRLGTGFCPRLDTAAPLYVQVRDLAAYAESFDSCNSKSCTACNATATIDLFANLLGQYAASLTISFVAGGGVLLAGGVTQTLGSRLAAPFLRGFHQDGALAYLLRRTPVVVAHSPHAGPLGAAISLLRHGRPARPAPQN